jgi:hypothetical protein
MFKNLMMGTMVMGMALAATSVMAGAGKTYQVTGPVMQLTDTKIVVEKGKEQWEIARTADTKVGGDLKVGAKVTIEYMMTATDVKVKADKPAAPAAK